MGSGGFCALQKFCCSRQFSGGGDQGGVLLGGFPSSVVACSECVERTGVQYRLVLYGVVLRGVVGLSLGGGCPLWMLL